MLSVDLCCVNEERRGKTPVNVCSWRNISNMGDHIVRSSDKKPPPTVIRARGGGPVDFLYLVFLHLSHRASAERIVRAIHWTSTKPHSLT
jgi:hypothetical protein